MKKKIRFFCALLAVFALLTGAALAADNPAGTTVDDNSEAIETNNGTVTMNHGTVTANNGTVTTNNIVGTVITNAIGGTVGDNAGTVATNNGTVTTNDGMVTTNTGTVFNYPGGVVTTNNGTVYDCGGTVTTNNGTVIRCGKVDLSVLDTVTGEAVNGWTVSGGFRDGSGNLWVSASGDYAAITFAPPAGYETTGSSTAITGTLLVQYMGNEVTIDQFVFNTVGDTAKIEIDVLAYPTLTPENAAVDLYRPADLVFTKKDGETTFKSLSLFYDDSEGNSHGIDLTGGTDYQIVGDQVTVFASALQQLPTGKAYLDMTSSYNDYWVGTIDFYTFYRLDVTNTLPERNVLASASPAAGGTVSADRQTAKAGDTVTVTATPAAGWKLKDILVDGSPITGNTFVMKDADAAVTAEFEPLTHAVSVTQPAAGGTVSADRQTAKAGDTVTVTATPAAGWKLKDILVDGSAITGNTFVMKDADAAVTAEFEPLPAEKTSPKTGDPGAAGWGLALLASGGALAVTVKKRGKAD